MSEVSQSRFPRAPLVGAAVLIGVSLLLAGGARLTGAGKVEPPASTALERLDLRFEDREDGAVMVYAAQSDEIVEVLAPGTNGFLRSVMRGLALERLRKGIGHEPPFSLTRWEDGRLSLEDPTTGRVVELTAFGPTNSGAFAQLMSARAE